MNNDLTCENKEEIRKHVSKLLVVPGVLLAVLLFLASYFIHDVISARIEAEASKIYSKAVERTSDKIYELIGETIEAKISVIRSKEHIEDILQQTIMSQEEARVLVEKIALSPELSKALKNQNEIARLLTANLINDSNFRNTLLVDVEKQIKKSFKLSHYNVTRIESLKTVGLGSHKACFLTKIDMSDYSDVKEQRMCEVKGYDGAWELKMYNAECSTLCID